MNFSQPENDGYSIVMADVTLKPEWRERFEFFKTYGAPNSPEARAAFKALSRNGRRLVDSNIFGFLFGPIYVFVLAMPKRALTQFSIGVSLILLTGVIQGIPLGKLFLLILGLSLGPALQVVFLVFAAVMMMFEPHWGILVDEFPRLFYSAVFCSALSSATVNYSYYLKQVKDDNGWNSFQGMKQWEMTVWPVFFIMVVVMVVRS